MKKKESQLSISFFNFAIDLFANIWMIFFNFWITMAKQQGQVYLGYEDEPINDKQTLLNYTVNKIGGFPVSDFIYNFS